MRLEIGPPFAAASGSDTVPGQGGWNGSFI